MKKKAFSICFLFILYFIPGCKSTSERVSDKVKEEIKGEVMDLFEKATEAVNNHDEDRMMEFFWNNEGGLYAADGILLEGWKAHYNVTRAIHSDSHYQSFRLIFNEVKIRVLSQDAALLIGKGVLDHFPLGDEFGAVDIAVTFLVEKKSDQWLITVGHESTQSSLFGP